MTELERLRKSVEFFRTFTKKVKTICDGGATLNDVRGLIRTYENQWPNWLDEGIENSDGDAPKPTAEEILKRAPKFFHRHKLYAFQHCFDKLEYVFPEIDWSNVSVEELREVLAATVQEAGMSFEDAKRTCHVRSAIYRKSKPKERHWKNTKEPFSQVSEEDKKATDWEEYDPRDDDDCSLFMYND